MTHRHEMFFRFFESLTSEVVVDVVAVVVVVVVVVIVVHLATPPGAAAAAPPPGFLWSSIVTNSWNNSTQTLFYKARPL